jgi:hypothetical protein
MLRIEKTYPKIIFSIAVFLIPNYLLADMSSENYRLDVAAFGETGSVMVSENYSLTPQYGVVSDVDEEEEVVEERRSQQGSNRRLPRLVTVRERLVSLGVDAMPVTVNSVFAVVNENTHADDLGTLSDRGMTNNTATRSEESAEETEGASSNENLEQDDGGSERLIESPEVSPSRTKRLEFLLVTLMLLYVFFRYTSVGKRWAFF